MRRPDETPTLEVIANILGALSVGLAMFILGNTICAGDDNLVDLD